MTRETGQFQSALDRIRLLSAKKCFVVGDYIQLLRTIKYTANTALLSERVLTEDEWDIIVALRNGKVRLYGS